MSKGFTLIELLTVSVILAVLAAVAIPAYNGYIRRSSDMMCEHSASTVLTSIVSYVQMKGDIPSGNYDISGLNSILQEYKVFLPEDYSADIMIVDKGNITVFIQDDSYMGTASLDNF